MLSTEGVLLLLLKRTVNSVLAKYFLILVMTQQIVTQSSIEGYAEAYRVQSEKGEKEEAYKDAYKGDDGNDYAETVVDYMHQVLDKDKHKEDSHEHDNKGHGNHKGSKRGKTKAEPNDYSDDYEYKDEPENEAGHLDPEVDHIIIHCERFTRNPPLLLD